MRTQDSIGSLAKDARSGEPSSIEVLYIELNADLVVSPLLLEFLW
jgi:hypothetical protein